VNWVNVFTNFADTDLLIATDVTAVGMPYRFYRGVSVSIEPSLVSGLAPAMVQIAAARVQPGNQFIFNFATTYVVSTNLVTWFDAGTNIAPASVLSYTNVLTLDKPVEFFRVVEKQ